MSFTNGGYADAGCDKSLDDENIPCTCRSSKSLRVRRVFDQIYFSLFMKIKLSY